jgi:hypothetical protein
MEIMRLISYSFIEGLIKGLNKHAKVAEYYMFYQKVSLIVSFRTTSQATLPQLKYSSTTTREENHGFLCTSVEHRLIKNFICS